MEGIEPEVPERLWQKLQAIRARFEQDTGDTSPAQIEGFTLDMTELGDMVETLHDVNSFDECRFRLASYQELDVILEHVEWYRDYIIKRMGMVKEVLGE